MKHEQVIPDSDLIKSYQRTGNIWKTADEYGISGQSVYARLNKLGIVKHINYWTEEDDAILLQKYVLYKMSGRLDELAKELGRTKQFVCRKAKRLGLTDNKLKFIPEEARLKIGERTKTWIRERGHPRGMLNHNHSLKTKEKLSSTSIKMWKDPNSYFNSDENKQRLSDLLHLRRINNTVNLFSNRGKHPVIIDNIKYVFKSSWEYEIALRLQKLKLEGSIKHWKYESKHFLFEDIKRGYRSYCPDFEVCLLDDEHLYIEVKGWKMEKSMKRIELFKERYPNVKFYLLDEHEYKKIISESDYLRRRCI